ncbi:MAG: hypothetical protein PHP53_12350 [Prolixibacteraceae bacterium]|nr:hypothetical protein [Prolixibacteraceae bacterium]
MNAIGGYFDFELSKGKEYHQNSIRLNTGRNTFEYILKVKNYKKVYLPYFTCEVMLEPIIKLDIQFEFYHIDNSLFPIFIFSQVQEHEVFVYTNYFGICDKQVLEISLRCTNLIIDNSQSFFSKPLPKIDTFYSPRKFFGVSDGAYLYIDKYLEQDLELDVSYERMSHLLKRTDCSAEFGFDDFKRNDDVLRNNPIRKMSKLTNAILSSINYDIIKQQRIENFYELHSYLKNTNKLKIELIDDQVPMVYPYYSDNQKLRGNLLKSNIYIATYWPNVMDWCSENELEYQFAKRILPLPVDQRYGIMDMKKIIQLIKKNV